MISLGSSPTMYRINENIRVKNIRVIHDNKNLGVLPTFKALQMARDLCLDLVEIAPDQNPPVCQILDYSKLKYDINKKARENKKQNVVHEKTVKIGINEAKHDMDRKLNQVIEFVNKNNKTLVTVELRGREMQSIKRAEEIFDTLLNTIKTLNINLLPHALDKNISGNFAKFSLQLQKKK